MYAFQIRMLPVGHFPGAEHQNATGREPFRQPVDDLAFPPAAEVDQHVLAENQIHVVHWRGAQIQHVEPGKADALAQYRRYGQGLLIAAGLKIFFPQ